jgi:hypothetical protein
MQQGYQCPRCGAQVAFGVRFCGSCQTPLNWPTQQQSPPPGPPQYQQQYQQQAPQYQQPYKAEPPKKKSKLGIISLVIVLFALAAVGSCVVCVMLPGTSKPAMTFETIGTKGATVLITLVSPSPDAVSNEDLANRLREDWQYNLDILPFPYNNQVHVMVFDNKDAPQRWLEIWDTMLSLSDEEWAKEQARIFPHRVANYDRNKTTGLHQVEILSRDASSSIVQTIKFQ